MSDLLNERQQARLLEATRERQQWIRSANLGHVVGVVDDLVMLRERQRDLMITAIRQVADKDRRKLFELDTGLFRFPDEKSVLPSSQLYVFLSGPPRDLLDSGQKFILDGHSTRSKMVRGRHTTRVPLPINAADELQMKRDIVAFLNMHRVDFARIVNERVAGLAESLALTDSQKRHLVVAGKGATKRCLVRWRSENIEKLQQMAEQVQRLGRADFGTLKISVRGPSVHALEDELVWQYAIAKITSNVSARRNHAERRKATVDYVTAMFDKELWLTPDQRERFSALIDASFPPVINIEQPHAKELELLVTPLFRVSADELKTVLRESQIAAWTSLGNQFERRGDQVILTLGDSSQVSFQLTP